MLLKWSVLVLSVQLTIRNSLVQDDNAEARVLCMRGASPESAALGVAASRLFAREALLSILSFGCPPRIKLKGSTRVSAIEP
jgi:hypothetical protein